MKAITVLTGSELLVRGSMQGVHDWSLPHLHGPQGLLSPRSSWVHESEIWGVCRRGLNTYCVHPPHPSGKSRPVGLLPRQAQTNRWAVPCGGDSILARGSEPAAPGSHDVTVLEYLLFLELLLYTYAGCDTYFVSSTPHGLGGRSEGPGWLKDRVGGRRTFCARFPDPSGAHLSYPVIPSPL